MGIADADNFEGLVNCACGKVIKVILNVACMEENK
jgi:hypothetical protein